MPGNMPGEVRGTGRCMCGAVTFAVVGELRDVLNCHCERCRRFTGHHMAATSARTSDVVIDDTGGHLRWFHPVPEAGYAFCDRCGSSLFWQSVDTERISIAAGTLDPPTGLVTTTAWWVRDASDYHVRPDIPELDTE